MHSQQPPNYNNSEPTEAQQLLPQEHEILRRFMAVVVSSAFRNSLILQNLATTAKRNDREVTSQNLNDRCLIGQSQGETTQGTGYEGTS